MEENYAKVSNSLLDAIMDSNLNGTQWSIVLIIIRFTMGNRMEHHELSLAFLAQELKRNREHIGRELNVLIDRNIVSVVSTGKRGIRRLKINTDIDQWVKEVK